MLRDGPSVPYFREHKGEACVELPLHAPGLAYLDEFAPAWRQDCGTPNLLPDRVDFR